MKTPKFYLKRGHWGDYGWVRVPWWQWLYNVSDRVNKVEWK